MQKGTIGNYLESHPIVGNCHMLRGGPNVRNVRTLPLLVKSEHYLTLQD